MGNLPDQVARIPAFTDQSAKPLDRLSVFGPPPLIPGEDLAAYGHLHARIAGAVKPKDFLEEIWVRDVLDLTWECLRLRRISAQLAADQMATSMKYSLEKIISTEKVQNLLQRWHRHEDEAIKEVNELLASRGASVDNILARTFDKLSNRNACEQIARLAAGAENRRNAALREIERHRSAVADALRRASDEAVEAEFEEVMPDPLPLKDAA